MQQNLESEKLCIDARRRLSMTNVETVDGFNETSLKLTVSGSRVIILGSGIKITAFNKATGNLSAEGKFFEIKYLGEKTSVIKKIFK